MRRREFIALVGGTVAWPPAARAQQPERVRVVGLLFATAPDDWLTQQALSSLRGVLESQGWTEGRNIRFELRTAPVANQLPALAGEITALRPDAIFAITAPAAKAVLAHTPSTPIVFAGVSDPVGTGIVSSLSRPGGNVTGIANAVLPLTGKWLELLKDVAPSVARAGLMFNPDSAGSRGAEALREFMAAAGPLQIAPVVAEVHNDAEIEAAISALGQNAKGGLIVTQDIFNSVHRVAIIKATIRHQVPSVYPFEYFAAQGGLMSFGVDPFEAVRLAAGYLARILRGEKPSNLPVQQPSTFRLIINLKTAKALGIEVPPTLLARADEVIE